MRKLLLLVAAVLLICALPAYATVMDTSLAVRDKLPAETLASLPDFISRMEAMGSKVSVDATTGYYVVYNENDLKEIFGEDALLLPSPPGLLSVSYKRSGTYRYWGMLHGLVVADTARKVITITKGGFISNADLNVNIAGEEVQINARDLTRSSFKISRDGVYSQNEHFIICEPESDTRAEECSIFTERPRRENRACTSEELTAYNAVHPAFSSQCNLLSLIRPNKAYLNMTIETAFILSNSLLEEYYHNNNYDARMELIYSARDAGNFLQVSNVQQVMLLPTNALNVWAMADEEGYIDGNNGGFSFNSEEGLLITTRCKSREDNDNCEQLLEITGNKAKISPDSELVIITEENDAISNGQTSIEVFEGHNRYKILTIKEGNAHIYTSPEGFGQCKYTSEPITDTCIFLSENPELKFKVGYISETYPLPFVADIDAKDIQGGRIILEVPADVSKKINVVRDGTATRLVFSEGNLTIEPRGQSWTDLGVSFTAKFSLSGALENQYESNVFDELNCNIFERKCYLNGIEVIGENWQSHFTKRCERDTGCAANQRCIEGLCITRSNCENLYGDEAQGGASLLFVSDSYPNQEIFEEDIEKIISPEGTGEGIFSVEPFKGNIDKFSFFALYGGNAPTWMGVPWYKYLFSFVKQCPSADFTLVLSKRGFRAGAIASTGSNSYSFAQVGEMSISTEEDTFPQTAIHEFGHVFGGLEDEYYEDHPGRNEEGFVGIPNCLPKETAINKWKEWPKIINDANAMKWETCGGGVCGTKCLHWLRPTENSVMNDHIAWFEQRSESGWEAFNEPSEAQLIERLNAYS